MENGKPGSEGLPYSSPEKVLGGPADDNPEQGLKPEKGVDGKGSVQLPAKGESL
jgi:hypothetical protein